MEDLLSYLPADFGVSWTTATSSLTGLAVAGPTVLRHLKPLVARVIADWRDALSGWREVINPNNEDNA